MISNVKKLRDKQITNTARIIVYAAPPGCCKTTRAISLANHNPKHKILFVSLEMSPIELSKRITNDNVDISDEMIWDEEILSKYDVIIIDYIQLLSKDKTFGVLNLAKELRNKYGINIIILSQLNRAGISYRNLKNSSYIEEVADKVVIMKRVGNDIIFKIEKDRYNMVTNDWYYMYKMENEKWKDCLCEE